MSIYFVLDVESAGLFGGAFCYGFSVVNEDGQELDFGYECVEADDEDATPQDFEWVQENILPYCPLTMGYGQDREDRTESLQNAFWQDWSAWKAKGALLCADVAWPVEANFLIDGVRFAKGLDPIGMAERLPNELPAHNPLNDARQSARLLIEALKL